MGDRLGITKKWTLSIHMPRAACCLVLEITDVREEQLNAISHDDACSEGIESTRGEQAACISRFRCLYLADSTEPHERYIGCETNGQGAYRALIPPDGGSTSRANGYRGRHQFLSGDSESGGYAYEC